MSRTQIGSAKKAKKFRSLTERDGMECYFCRVEMNTDYPRNRQTRTMDHVVPVDAGGSNCNENIVLACDLCNNERGTQDFLEFIDFFREPTYLDHARLTRALSTPRGLQISQARALTRTLVSGRLESTTITTRKRWDQ